MSADTEALDADGLLEEAQRQTGLDDLGAAALPTIVLTNLTNRLRVVEHLKQHPQAADEPIEAPVVVIGLFRAGTTLLSQLLDLDPGARSLLGWESQDVATRWTRVLLESVDRVEDFRRRHPDHPVLDLHYRQLVADPLATVAQVYEFTRKDVGGHDGHGDA